MEIWTNLTAFVKTFVLQNDIYFEVNQDAITRWLMLKMKEVHLVCFDRVEYVTLIKLLEYLKISRRKLSIVHLFPELLQNFEVKWLELMVSNLRFLFFSSELYLQGEIKLSSRVA